MRTVKNLRGVFAAACLAVGLLGMMAAGATATRSTCVVVNVRANQRYSTLQAAVDAAMAGDTLKVGGICYGDTTISKNLTIVGGWVATLNGENNASTPGHVVTVPFGVHVTLSGLTITGGYAEEGGGIYNDGSLTLNHSPVTGNQAYWGGGILDEAGSVTLNNSTISDNTGTYGGGIYGEVGSLTLYNSIISGNRAEEGGGILSFAQSLTLRNSTVSDNTAIEGSGGLFEEEGSVTLNNSTISDNTAAEGGGISDEYGSLTLNNSTISGNRVAEEGGGILSYHVVLTLNASTVSDNTAGDSRRRWDLRPERFAHAQRLESHGQPSVLGRRHRQP